MENETNSSVAERRIEHSITVVPVLRSRTLVKMYFKIIFKTAPAFFP